MYRFPNFFSAGSLRGSKNSDPFNKNKIFVLYIYYIIGTYIILKKGVIK